MRSIKSAKNYQCSFKKNQSCSDSQNELKVEPKGSKFWKNCTMNCAYKKSKSEFIDYRNIVSKDIKKEIFNAFDTDENGELILPEYLRKWSSWARIGREFKSLY